MMISMIPTARATLVISITNVLCNGQATLAFIGWNVAQDSGSFESRDQSGRTPFGWISVMLRDISFLGGSSHLIGYAIREAH